MSMLLRVLTMLLWATSYNETPPAHYNLRIMYSRGYVATDAGQLTFVYYDPEHPPNDPYQYRTLKSMGFRFAQWRGGSGWNGDWQYTAVDVPFFAIFLSTDFVPKM